MFYVYRRKNFKLRRIFQEQLELGLKGHKLGKILCRAPKQKTHGKVSSLPCVFILAHGKEREKLSRSPSVLTVLHRCQHEQRTFQKKLFAVRYKKTHGTKKTHGKVFFYCAFSLCRPFIKRTAKKLFAVRPIENARQRFSRMAKVCFPVMRAFNFLLSRPPGCCFFCLH
jgi:hypothetical protein